MSVFSKLFNKYKRATPKQLVTAGVFMLAFAAAVGGGLASRATSTAAFYGECDSNAVMYCGAVNAQDFCNELSDDFDGRNWGLKAVYADSKIGLPYSECGKFANEAKDGVFHRNGNITVDGVVFASGAQSMGRQNFRNSTWISVGGQGFYYGTPAQRWASGTQTIPVMVWFDEWGNIKTVIMKPCGNPIPYMDKKKSGAECKDLIKTPVVGKKNTYRFTTSASSFGYANIVKYEYYYNDGDGDKKFGEATKGDEAVEKTFTKAAKVHVKVTVSLPFGKTKTITSKLCEAEVGVVKEEFLYACKALIATKIDNRTFRFTAVPKNSNNVTVVSADFTLDGSVTTKGVTDKDDDGNFYKVYKFNDNKTHTVQAVINFIADGKEVKSDENDCVAKVTPDKEPECKPGIPVGDKRCEDLPVTGPGHVAALFTGVSALGALGHRLFTTRRRG